MYFRIPVAQHRPRRSYCSVSEIAHSSANFAPINSNRGDPEPSRRALSNRTTLICLPRLRNKAKFAPLSLNRYALSTTTQPVLPRLTQACVILNCLDELYRTTLHSSACHGCATKGISSGSRYRYRPFFVWLPSRCEWKITTRAPPEAATAARELKNLEFMVLVRFAGGDSCAGDLEWYPALPRRITMCVTRVTRT